jgi:hypothetical protein
MLYRTLNFPHKEIISKKFNEFCNDNKYNTIGVYWPKNSHEYLFSIPEFKEDVTALNMENYISGITINVIDNVDNNFVHIDPYFPTTHRYRMIFPISGYEKTWISYYESDVDPDLSLYVPNPIDPELKFQHYSDPFSVVKEIGRASFEDVLLIDTYTLHCAFNIENNTRILGLIGLKPDLDINSIP